MKMIDSHVHIYPEFLKKERDRIAAREPWFEMLTSSRFHKWGTACELIEAMDASGVERSFATTFAFRDIALCREMNDHLFEAAKNCGGRIVPLAVVPPASRDAVREAERAFDMGAAGIGELFPDGQGFALDDARTLRALCETCRERGKFIMFHTAEQAGHCYAGKGTSGAREAAAFCRSFPLVPVVFAHFGGGLWAFSAMPEMKLLAANAYFDTAAWPWLYEPRVMDALFAAGAGDKILFGSDWPLLRFERYKEHIERTGLASAEKAALLAGNAERLLSLCA